jgi:hypothetical protein
LANPTTNYGFVLPTSSDLVTDLPADFDVALQGVDTRLKALQPGTTLGDLVYSSATANTNTRLPIGTTGQVLAVSGGVPAWTTTSDVTPLTTKGDLFTFTTVDARIGVGANGTVLTADSAEASGLKWTTPASGAYTSLATGSLSGSAVTISSIAGTYRDLVLVLSDAYMSASTGISYNVNGTTGIYATGLGAGGYSPLAVDSTRFYSNADFNSSSQTSSEITTFQNYASSTWKTAKLQTFSKSTATEYAVFDKLAGIRLASAITSITITAQSGTFSAGTYILYGVK